MRAAWISTVDNIDWPSKPGLSDKQMKAEMISILDNLRSNNLNTVIFKFAQLQMLITNQQKNQLRIG